MISYGELFLTVAAAVALFGPKDIPIVARAAGKFVGKAVGYVQSARGQFDSVVKHSQIDQVHKELQETMAQLEAIRYEIHNGMSISNPGPLTRSVLNVALKPNSPDSPSQADVNSVVHAHNQLKQPSGTQEGISGTQVVHAMQELRSASAVTAVPNFVSGGFGTMASPVASITPVGFQPGPDGTFNTVPPSTERVVVRPIGVKPASVKQPSMSSGDMQQDIVVLPISALSAGLLSPRTGPLSGGVDLVLESITERKVAFDTKAFLKQTEMESKIPLEN